MKKIFIFLVFCTPFCSLGQASQSPNKNKIAALIVRPDRKHLTDLERNLPKHHKEYHKGDLAVDVYEVMTGPRTGELHIVSRTTRSWTEMEKDARRTPDHVVDWERNISPFLTQEGPSEFVEWGENSYLPANPADVPQAEKLEVIFIDVQPGMDEEFNAGMKKIKEMFQKNNSKVYYNAGTRAFGIGSQTVIVVPLAKGLESLEPDPASAWPTMFKNAFPKEDFAAWMKKFNSTQQKFESFLVLHRKDLSSD